MQTQQRIIIQYLNAGVPAPSLHLRLKYPESYSDGFLLEQKL